MDGFLSQNHLTIHFEYKTVNVANSISIFRLLLIPVFIGLVLAYEPGREWVRWLAFATFVTAALSDAVDGYVARHFDQRTKFGTVLDPLADKLLINLALVFLAVTPHFRTQVPMWLPVVILGRDIIIGGGAFLLNKFMGPIQPQPRVLGKISTIGHSVGVAWVLTNWPYGREVLLAMVFVSLTSLVDYLLHGYQQVLPDKSVPDGDSN